MRQNFFYALLIIKVSEIYYKIKTERFIIKIESANNYLLRLLTRACRLANGKIRIKMFAVNEILQNVRFISE